MSEQASFAAADLRSTAQDYKREAARKHKWALGATDGVGRADGKPRPQRPAETDSIRKRRAEKVAVASYAQAAKVARKHDMLDGAAVTDDSSGSNSDESDETPWPPVDAGVTYSFDAVRSPSKGSQILNVALAKAVERFEERETVKLVKSEYELLDSDGEPVLPSSMKTEKKRKGKAARDSAILVAEDEDYEFV